MKTHQEIRDAINQAELMPSEDTTGGIFKILHALNDRVEEVKEYTRSADSRTSIITANLGSALAAIEQRSYDP